MKNAKAAGTSREHRIKKELEAKGWVVVRSPASGSPVDLWALRRWLYTSAEGIVLCDAAEAWAIQVKANSGSPFKNFQPAEREDLQALAAKAGATAWLVHWPPRGLQTWIPKAHWPAIRSS